MNQSTPRCRMCSWHNDITGYHSEETDDWYIDEGDLKDLTMNKITVDQTVQGTIEILQLQHSDNVVNISVGRNRASPTGTGHDEDRQRSHSYSEIFTDADFRQNS